MDIALFIFGVYIISTSRGIYINEILEGPCSQNHMFYHSIDDKMISSSCDISIDLDCAAADYTIDGVSYYDRSNSRNVTLCGTDKLDKKYITSNDIETELLSANTVIETNENIEINYRIQSSSSSYSLSLITNQSIMISSNIQHNGGIFLHVKYRNVIRKNIENNTEYENENKYNKNIYNTVRCRV